MAHEVEEATAAVRAVLDDASFGAAWEKGRNMSLEDAVELALES